MDELDDVQQDQATESNEPAATDDPKSTAELEAQLQAASEEIANYKDKYLRERAEMENFRKRQERLAADRVQRNKRELLEKVLEVMDNLDRAMRFGDSMDRESLQQGLRMVQWQLNELLRTEGLTPVDTVGERFDPHVHEAVENVASGEYPMLRPARVKVSTGSGH